MTIQRTRFTAPQRLLHWLMALCVFAMLFIGIGMVSIVTPKYLTLIQVHKTLGITILALALIRLVMRFVYGAPALPADLPAPIKLAAHLSHYAFYALMIGMPLVGWAMLSAASHPVVLFGGLHLPPILPVDPVLAARLRCLHHLLGFAFFGLILAHIAAALFHKLIRKDGVFEAMAPACGADRPEA